MRITDLASGRSIRNHALWFAVSWPCSSSRVKAYFLPLGDPIKNVGCGFVDTDVRSFLLRFGLLLAASYGLLYFSHKFYDPLQVQHTDFLDSYYRMYQNPLDFTAADARHVYRQISAVITHALFVAGIDYPNEIAFNDPAFDARIFFAALATNYFGLVSAATLAGGVTKLESGGFVFPLLAGLFCILSFHSQIVVITGLTEGVTWLFFAALYLLYVRENRAIFAILLALSIFQREMISVVFGLIAAFSLLTGLRTRRYNQFVLAASILCFGTYALMRLYIIPAPGPEEQLTFSNLIGNLMSIRIPLRDLVFRVLLPQNVMLISIAIAAVVWVRAGAPPRELFVLLLTFAAILVIGLAEGIVIGSDIGRVAGLLSPAFAALAARDLFRLEGMTRTGRAAG